MPLCPVEPLPNQSKFNQLQKSPKSPTVSVKQPIETSRHLGLSEESAVRLVPMNHEFRVGAATEFVEIHADALAVGVDAEGDEAVENPEE